MKRNRGHDAHDSDDLNGSHADRSTDSGDLSIAETKRLRVRRRFLKGGVGGTTAMILSLYQRPGEAKHRGGGGGGDKNKKMSIDCILPDGSKRKVGLSVCMSLAGVKKG